MAHEHSVYDSDTRFSINSTTRQIRNDSSRKTLLIQNDHNSERFTFELPRYIESHDMSVCNKVEVHFLNIDTKTKNQRSGVYTVDDLQISPDDSEKVICSWLISNNATQLVGLLNFVVRYSCLDGTTVTYAWNTAIASVNISDGINSGDDVISEYSDVLELWKKELFAAGYINASEMQNDISILEQRIDNLASLKDGSTTGDAELIDIRVGADGNTYASAGAAVRSGMSVIASTIDSAMSFEYLPIAYEEMNDTGFALNSNGQVILMANEGAVTYCGIIAKAGHYNLGVSTLLTPHELNTSEYKTYLYYSANANSDVYVDAGTRFYVLGKSNPVPELKVAYMPGQIVVAVSPKDGDYTITTGDEIECTEIGALLTEEQLLVNVARYQALCFPVIQGGVYRLRSSGFDFPSAVYQLFGFAKTTVYKKNSPYIKGGIRTDDGVIDIVLRSPVDGYLLVSNDSNTPAGFTLVPVTAMTYRSFVDRNEVQPYRKLLTIGDSLSGNNNLWQPTVIELLNIPEYGILGGAGLTVADQGSDVNTIYNRVMTMDSDETVDLISFWGGYNDFSGNIPLSSLNEQIDPDTRDPSTFYGGVLDCVEKILSTYPLKTIVMVGTTPFRTSGGSWQDRVNNHGLKIADYVDAFREIAEHYSIPFLDLLHTSGFNDYNYSTYYIDQSYWLHPNSDGNALIGRKIAGFIKSIEGTY